MSNVKHPQRTQGILTNVPQGAHLLEYERNLKITLQVRETGIVQLLANVIHGK